MPRDPEIDRILYGEGGPPKAAKGVSSDTPESADYDQTSGTKNFARGVGQGLLGYVEAPAYYAEKGIRQFAPGFRMPLHEWAKRYREAAEATPEGVAGEITGSVAPMFTPMGWLGAAARGAMGGADAVRIAEAARLATAARTAGATRTAEAARLARTGEKGRELAQGGAGATEATERLGLDVPRMTIGERGTALAEKTVTPAWEALGPGGQGAVKGATLGVMAQPATSREELQNQALGGGLFGGAAGRLGQTFWPRTPARGVINPLATGSRLAHRPPEGTFAPRGTTPEPPFARREPQFRRTRDPTGRDSSFANRVTEAEWERPMPRPKNPFREHVERHAARQGAWWASRLAAHGPLMHWLGHTLGGLAYLATYAAQRGQLAAGRGLRTAAERATRYGTPAGAVAAGRGGFPITGERLDWRDPLQ